MTYNPFSVIVVPFPFTDKGNVKRRPALVLSSLEHQKQTAHITLLMITSAKHSAWPSDYSISHLKDTGLTSPSIVRQKIFTIDSKLVIKHIGKLSAADHREILKRLKLHFNH